MGNRPTPSAINKLRGNPGRRGRNKLEPKPCQGIDTRPAWLNPEAKREWARIVPELELIGLLTKVDRAILAIYCEIWGQFVDAVKAGKPLNVPAMAQMRLYAVEMGLTPAARVKLQVERAVPPPEDGDPWADYLAKEGGQN